MPTEPQRPRQSTARPTVDCHPHSIEVVERPEGYREFRCSPAFWTYPPSQSDEGLAAELLGEDRGVDKYGLGEGVEFWSGSDAGLRLRTEPPQELAHRELVALASRRSVGLNAPRVWLSASRVDPILARWTAGTPERRREEADRATTAREDVWNHYGMRKSVAEPVIWGWGMRRGDRSELGRIGQPWKGGTGVWYRWSTVREWKRWPRRQGVESEAVRPDPGKLLLFVSHRWDGLNHPDETGAQLACLQIGLTLALAKAVLHHADQEEAFKTASGLPELLWEFLKAELPPEAIESLAPWAQRVEHAARTSQSEDSFLERLNEGEPSASLRTIQDCVLIWYDYCSMLQAPRTEPEEAEFRAEIMTLNDIQANACTVVIAGDRQYLFRAWCFLELCGGMRHRIAELTPTWGTRVGLGDSVTVWAHRSDQLIAALCTHGTRAISGSGLAAAHPDDLPDIARLLAQLELTGLLVTDDSDLIGGSIPFPRRSRE